MQLLLKSSQDKKFVCEAAESALVALTRWVSPVLLLPKLQPYITHRNPRIRAKASICISQSVPRLVSTLGHGVLFTVFLLFLLFCVFQNSTSACKIIPPKSVKVLCGISIVFMWHYLQGIDGIEIFGIDKLIVIGASQLSDRLPESRDAARALLLELKSAYEKSQVPELTAVPEQSEVPKTTDVPEQPVVASWKDFCQSKLSPLSAQAVLRVTNSAREEGLYTKAFIW